MKTLATYEGVLDQLVNKKKSHFLLISKTPSLVVGFTYLVTGFSKKK